MRTDYLATSRSSYPKNGVQGVQGVQEGQSDTHINKLQLPEGCTPSKTQGVQDRASKKLRTDTYLRAETHLAHQKKDYSNGTDKNRQGADDLRGHFEERAAILEYDAGLPRTEAELLRADYPLLLAQVSDRPGPVDALPLGVAKLAVLKGKHVVRQGTFSGAHHVTTTREDRR